MRQLEKNDKSSKSLLANVLDLEDDFLICSRSGLSATVKPARPNYLPTILSQQSSCTHANADVNMSPAGIDPSFFAKNTPNFNHYPGMT